MQATAREARLQICSNSTSTALIFTDSLGTNRSKISTAFKLSSRLKTA